MANWYVDNEATGANDGTSWTNAWESFATLISNWSSVSPGDTVFISGGDTEKFYYETLTCSRSGTSGNVITIDSGANSPDPTGHDGIVTIDAETTRNYCVSMSGSYITVKNLHLYRGYSYTGYVTGNHNTFEKCKIEDGRVQGIRIDGDYCTITFCQIITLEGTYSGQTDGIVLYGQNTGAVIEKNYILQRNHGDPHLDCIQGNMVTDPTIRWNYCENRKTSESFADAQGIYLTQGMGTQKIYGNIIYMVWGGTGIGTRNLPDLDPGWGEATTYIIGNTTKCGSYRNIWNTEESNPIIKNNIMWCNRVYNGLFCLQVPNFSGTASNIDHNLYYSQAINSPDISQVPGTCTLTEMKALGMESGGIYANPSLASNLAPDSGTDPSVGAGDNTLGSEYKWGIATTTDVTSGETWWNTFELVDRDITSDGDWDIGAYQWDTGATPPVTPSGIIKQAAASTNRKHK